MGMFFEDRWALDVGLFRPGFWLVVLGQFSFITTLFLVGSDATLPINLYLQVRDGSTPVINAISFLLILGTSTAAVANLYFSKKER